MRATGLTALCLLFLTSPTGNRASEPTSSPGLAELLEPIREKHDLPALAGGIIHGDGTIVVAAVGVRATDSPDPVTVDDLWHIGSCTKAITATLIAALIEKEILAWETTIGESFPDLKDEIDPGWLDVTIELLLAHRSGLPEDRDPNTKIFAKVRKLDGPMIEQRRELVKLALGEAPSYPSGTRMEYANYGYVIAGAMAEAATGKPWEELIKIHVCEPLGMTSVGFGPPGDPEELDQPRGHNGNNPVKPGPWADNPPVLGPAGTIHLTLSDWARFIAVHVTGARGDGDFLSPESFEKLQTPIEGGEFSMGWMVVQRPWAGGTALTHSGSNTIWFAVTWLAPERDFAVMALTNSGASAAPLACDEAASALILKFFSR